MSKDITKKRYTIGIDFGTLSGRALLVDITDGTEISQSVFEYTHGVMDDVMPSGEKLPPYYALQHPKDYLDVLAQTVPDVIEKSGIEASAVIGIGVDFTACTMLPVRENGTPLCFEKDYYDDKHAYVKMWKHHAAQREADQITDLAKQRNEEWLSRYGGKVSSEWMEPKILQILNEAPYIYEQTERFIEAGDWIVWMLTGEEKHSSSFAGYKALWHKKDGYPSKEFFAAIDERLRNIVGTKLSTDITIPGERAGELNCYGAKLTGLCEGTIVTVPQIDAHAAMPALKITNEGTLMMILGTSTCHILNGKVEIPVEGISGVVEDAVIPGYYTYEAGQACCGDHFDWFVKNCVPKTYYNEARDNNINIHKLLREKAKKLRVGQSGLLALDWWNGNRSVLGDSNLTGMIVGMTLQTKPEEIYRALIEATAYGTRIIIEMLSDSGVEISNIIAAGGIAEKDDLLMQIYSDVTKREIRISGSSQAVALGSAIYAAVASHEYPTIEAAALKMGKLNDKVYKPITENTAVYDEIFNEYKTLHDYFGRGLNNVMKKLKNITQLL